MGAKASSHTADQTSDGMVAGRKPTCDETEQCDGMVAGRKPTHDETEQCDGMVAGRKPTHDETEQCDGMVAGRKPRCNEIEQCDGMVAERRPTRDETEQSSHLHVPLNMTRSFNFLVVASIDIGSAYTGCALSYRHDYLRDPLKIHVKTFSNKWFHVFEKAPTCVLFDPQMRFSKFGYDAEDKYKSLADGDEEDQDHRKWFFFRRFKMTLFDKMKLQGQCMLDDETGKKMPALDVFSAVIEYLKNDLYRLIPGLGINLDICWILTVPDFWTDTCKQFMREAANKAGIKNENLLIALQSQAALMYFRTVPRHRFYKTGKGSEFELVPGSKYMVFDASDGIEYLCITVHKVEESGHSRRLYALKWGNQGAIDLDQAFTNFLASIVGNNIMNNWQMNNSDDFLDLLRNFHIAMQSFRMINNKAMTIFLPSTLHWLFEKDTNQTLVEFVAAKYQLRGSISLKENALKISAATVRDIFSGAYESILKHFEALCCSGQFENVPTILVVGKFLEYPILQEMIKGRFKDKTILIPEMNHADNAVLVGAVTLGHDPTLIEKECCHKT